MWQSRSPRLTLWPWTGGASSKNLLPVCSTPGQHQGARSQMRQSLFPHPAHPLLGYFTFYAHNFETVVSSEVGFAMGKQPVVSHWEAYHLLLTALSQMYWRLLCRGKLDPIWLFPYLVSPSSFAVPLLLSSFLPALCLHFPISWSAPNPSLSAPGWNRRGVLDTSSPGSGNPECSSGREGVKAPQEGEQGWCGGKTT